MADRPLPRLRAVHMALADPLRIQLFELIAAQPRTAGELSRLTGRKPNGLYHHLAQLEEGGLIEVTEYRRAASGKAERVYAAAVVEPPADAAAPAEYALFASAMLEAMRSDVTAAAQGQEAGEHRTIGLVRGVVKVNERRLAELRALVEEFIYHAQDQPDPDGAWTTVLWATADRQERSTESGQPDQLQ